MKKFDHPEQVTLHLVSAMGCCDTQPSDSNLNLISALRRQKAALQTQIKILHQRSLVLPSLNQLSDEVHYLQEIIFLFENQNIQARKVGLSNMNNVAETLTQIEKNYQGKALSDQALEREFMMQMEINRQLNLQIEDVKLKIKLLHQSNNDIVRNFAH